jgi:hypothetical protein
MIFIAILAAVVGLATLGFIAWVFLLIALCEPPAHGLDRRRLKLF